MWKKQTHSHTQSQTQLKRSPSSMLEKITEETKEKYNYQHKLTNDH